MKAVLILLSAVFVTGALRAEEQKPAEKLFALIDFEKTGTDASRAALGPVLEMFRKQGLPEPAIEEIGKAMDSFCVRTMKDPEIRTDMVKLYESKFTQDELKQLVAFYETPLGRKSLTTMPVLMQEGAVIGQRVAQKYTPELQKQIGEIVAKHKPSSAAPKGE